jgi:hypothetical protein
MKLYAASHPGQTCASSWPAAWRPTARCAALRKNCADNGFSFDAPPLAYCTDNAAMIALAGAERLALGISDDLDAVARPRWPLDEAAALSNPEQQFRSQGSQGMTFKTRGRHRRGAWGTALAQVCARAGLQVTLQAREPEVVASAINAAREHLFLPA